MFKPLLCPNQLPDIDTINFPIYASNKLDGIRCIFHPELGIVSRSLKQIQNKQLCDKFLPILEYVKKYNIVLDGEIYSHGRTFQEITRAVMTQDLYDEKVIKKLKKEGIEDTDTYIGELLHDMQFHCFDALRPDFPDEPFRLRWKNLQQHIFNISSNVVKCPQILCKYKEDLLSLLEHAYKENYEGLILKSVEGQYKFGRGTLKEGICYKIKPYIEKSGIITGVVQATKVNPNAEKEINELGYSVTSKKKDDRILINKATAFTVDWVTDADVRQLKVVIAATDAEKEDIWDERDLYIGKEVLFKYMDVGMKELPRHPIALRWWREDE